MVLNRYDRKNIVMAAVFFFLSTAITWYFIYCGASLYHFDEDKMILSCSIAGAKWGLQLLGAFLFLKDKRWLFIKGIAGVCLIGSLILLPFCFEPLRTLIPGNEFLVSLIAAVAAMLFFYHQTVRSLGVSIKWYLFWVLCLAIAISLQLTVVFHVV